MRVVLIEKSDFEFTLTLQVRETFAAKHIFLRLLPLHVG